MNLNKAQIEASTLLESLGWDTPGDLSLEEIAYTLNADVKRADLKGSMGRILMHENNAIIKINSKVRLQTRINFILAHEIGHLILHRDIEPLFSDNIETLNEWYAHGRQEIEANSFASELLMPSWLFRKKVAGRILNLDLIREIGDFFGTSQTATMLKYRDLGDFSVTVIYSENGIVQWKTESSDFPLKFLPRGSRVPEYSAAGEFYIDGDLENEPILLDAIEWFPEDFEIKNYQDTKLFEHNFRIGKNGLLTCLWME